MLQTLAVTVFVRVAIRATEKCQVKDCGRFATLALERREEHGGIERAAFCRDCWSSVPKQRSA